MPNGEITADMTDPKPTRWFHLTPDRLVIGLLVVECLLWLSERFQWLEFNHHKGWTVLIAVAVVGLAMCVMLGWYVLSLLLRWQFQFSIPLLAVLVVVVALPCSWLAIAMKEAREQRETVEMIHSLDGHVWQDWQIGANDQPLLPEPVWLRDRFGDDFFTSLVHVDFDARKLTDAEMGSFNGLSTLQSLNLNRSSITDIGLNHVKGLIRLQTLCLTSTKVTDSGLNCLKGLNELQDLALGDTNVTDSGLNVIGSLPQLRELYLNGTQVTDTGIERLKDLLRLQVLLLSDTKITDVGLDCLKGMPELRELHLYRTQVTDEGVKKLQQALPNCSILR